MDTNDEIVYRVRLLYRRHDELVMRFRRKDNEGRAREVRKKFPNVDQVCRSLKEKYEYADKKYAIVAPEGITDIMAEGDVLCHCVGKGDQYWDRIQRREAFILFLRKADSPDAPFYTLEIEPGGTIRQKRGKFNRSDQDGSVARKFLQEWQKEVAKRLTDEDRKAAAVSRELREQEFEQLRQDNVIIRAGALAGRRLVDVLTADLMEAAA